MANVREVLRAVVPLQQLLSAYLTTRHSVCRRYQSARAMGPERTAQIDDLLPARFSLGL